MTESEDTLPKYLTCTCLFHRARARLTWWWTCCTRWMNEIPQRSPRPLRVGDRVQRTFPLEGTLHGTVKWINAPGPGQNMSVRLGPDDADVIHWELASRWSRA